MKSYISVILFCFIAGGCHEVANGQDYVGENLKLFSSMYNISQTQFTLTNELQNQFNTAQLQLTLAANNLLLQLQISGVNISFMQTFLSSLDTQLNSIGRQLATTYSPANIMTYIVSTYQAFISNLSTTSEEVQTLYNLFYSKINDPKAQQCMASFTQSTFDIYSTAGKNFTILMQNSTVQTRSKLIALRDDIEKQVRVVVNLFKAAKQNPSTAVQNLIQFIQTNSNNITSKINEWSTQFQSLLNDVRTDIQNKTKAILDEQKMQTSNAAKVATNCLK